MTHDGPIEELFPELPPRAEPRVLWRTGRHVGRHIYLQAGPEPSDSDVPIGTLDTAELAAEACEARNARAGAAEMAADDAESGQERDSSPAAVSQDPGTLSGDPGAAESYPTSFAEFAVCWGAEDPNDCAGPIAGDAGLLVYEDEEEASRMTQWIGDSYVARCKVTRGRWERVEGSPF